MSFQKLMILLLLCHFQSDSKYKKKTNKKGSRELEVDFTETKGVGV